MTELNEEAKEILGYTREPPKHKVLKPATLQCVTELMDWARKWGPYKPETVFQDLKIEAKDGRMVTIRATTFVDGNSTV